MNYKNYIYKKIKLEKFVTLLLNLTDLDQIYINLD